MTINSDVFQPWLINVRTYAIAPASVSKSETMFLDTVSQISQVMP